MKNFAVTISLLAMLTGCARIVSEDLLVDKEGVKYYEASLRPYSGRVHESWDNGNMKLEGSYKRGKEEGTWTWWYYSGQKLCEGTFDDGKRGGIWIWWFEHGQKSREESYADGLLDGKSTMWREDGEILGETIYRDGKPVAE
ncbi:MAG: hypothetical protein V3U24_07405 [Candidatus Neomarinimicrobiota bacterium]